jgi:hypothetical protein
MLALGPIALLITGVTVAMQAYEENWGGFKDAVQTALPFLKESNEDLKEAEDILENDRKAMEGYTSAIDNMNSSMKKLEPQHKLYLEMHRDAFLAMDKNSKLAAYYSSQLAGLRTGPQGFSTPSVGGGLPSRGGISVGGGIVAGGGVTTAGGVSTGGVSSAPTTGGIGTPTTVTGSSQLLSLADPHGTNEQRFVFTMLPKEEKMNVLLTKAQLSMNDGLYGAANILFEEYEKVKAKPEMETDPVKRWENMQKGVKPKETGFRLAETRPQNLLKPHDLAGDGGIFNFDLDNRELVKTALGVDIGAIAHTVNVNEAIRLGTIQKSLSRFNPQHSKYITQMKSFTTGKAVKPGAGLMSLLEGSGIETGTAEFRVRSRNPLYGQATGGREAELMREIRNLGGINDLGQTSATQLYQVARVFNPTTGNMDSPIRASQEFYDRIRIKDANTTRLRFGGRLRDGFSIYDEDAVIGGYSSRKAFSDASKKKFFADLGEANTMMQFFGAGVRDSAIRGRSSRRFEYRRVVNTAQEIMATLRTAGLSYKTAPTDVPGLRGPATTAWFNMKDNLARVIGENHQTLARARQINILSEDYELQGFFGSSLSLPSLQEKLAMEDARMKSIGLTRTEAFQIIDTEGRGREEIDDRIRFKDRMSSMSTGVSVL